MKYIKSTLSDRYLMSIEPTIVIKNKNNTTTYSKYSSTYSSYKKLIDKYDIQIGDNFGSILVRVVNEELPVKIPQTEEQKQEYVRLLKEIKSPISFGTTIEDYD